MVTSDYTVRLEAFEGPLDLLLFLIRRAEVEIADIPIARITEQYLRHLEQLGGETGRVDIERAGEFLVMAATLMEIKSRMLTPRPESQERTGPDQHEEADPRAELVRQLLEYKQYRDATDRLDRCRQEWDARFPAAGLSRSALKSLFRAADAEAEPGEDDAPAVELDDVGVIDLVEAFARIIDTVDFNRVGEHRVVMDDTPVELHAEDIVDRLRSVASPAGLEFASLFAGKTRPEAIGMFLAVLELVKQQRVTVAQEEARIVLRLKDADPLDPTAPAPGDGA